MMILSRSPESSSKNFSILYRRCSMPTLPTSRNVSHNPHSILQDIASMLAKPVRERCHVTIFNLFLFDLCRC